MCKTCSKDARTHNGRIFSLGASNDMDTLMPSDPTRHREFREAYDDLMTNFELNNIEEANDDTHIYAAMFGLYDIIARPNRMGEESSTPDTTQSLIKTVSYSLRQVMLRLYPLIRYYFL